MAEDNGFTGPDLERRGFLFDWYSADLVKRAHSDDRICSFNPLTPASATLDGTVRKRS